MGKNKRCIVIDFNLFFNKLINKARFIFSSKYRSVSVRFALAYNDIEEYNDKHKLLLEIKRAYFDYLITTDFNPSGYTILCISSTCRYSCNLIVTIRSFL